MPLRSPLNFIFAHQISKYYLSVNMKPSLPIVALVVIILGLTVSVLLLTSNKKPEADSTAFLQERTETVVLPSHTEYLKSSLKVRPNAKYAGSYKYRSMTPQMLASQASQHKVKNESNTGKAWAPSTASGGLS